MVLFEIFKLDALRLLEVVVDVVVVAEHDEDKEEVDDVWSDPVKDKCGEIFKLSAILFDLIDESLNK